MTFDYMIEYRKIYVKILKYINYQRQTILSINFLKFIY